MSTIQSAIDNLVTYTELGNLKLNEDVKSCV